jgi:hypothetical protein
MKLIHSFEERVVGGGEGTAAATADHDIEIDRRLRTQSGSTITS